MISLAEQDRLARKAWGHKLVKGQYRDNEDLVISKNQNLSDYAVAEKLNRLPSSIHRRRSILEREQPVKQVMTKRLRESKKAKRMEQLSVGRRDAYVNKVLEDAPPLTGAKRAVVEQAFEDRKSVV